MTVAQVPAAQVAVAQVPAAQVAVAQEDALHADFRRESERVSDACKDFSVKAIPGCAIELFTDHPLHIGDVDIPCYVLEDGTRVLSQRGLIAGLGMGTGKKLASLSSTWWNSRP